MKKKIFICCSLLPVRKFLEKRFGDQHHFIERHAAIFKTDEDMEFIQNLIQIGDIEELIFTQDLDCVFLRDIVLQQNKLEFPHKAFLVDLYQKHFTEIEKEVKTTSKIAALYLAYLDYIQLKLQKTTELGRMLKLQQLEVKGMLTQVQNEKSIEFQLNLANQSI